MTSHPPRRTYVDASVFGGVFDEEFAEDSRRFFEQAELGRFTILSSVLVTDELVGAPNAVRELYDRTLRGAELVPVTEAAMSLQQAYLRNASSRQNGATTHYMLRLRRLPAQR